MIDFGDSEDVSIEFMKFGIDRAEGVRVMYKHGFADADTNNLLIRCLPNGEIVGGTTKIIFEDNHVFLSIIYKDHGSKGGVLLRFYPSSLTDAINTVGSLIDVNIENIPNWQYRVNYLSGLRYLLEALEHDRKIIVVADKTRFILFILSLVEYSFKMNLFGFDSVAYSGSVWGIERIHGVPKLSEIRDEIKNLDDYCLVNLYEGTVIGKNVPKKYAELENQLRKNRELPISSVTK